VVLEELEGLEGGGTGEELVRELGLVLAAVDRLVGFLRLVCYCMGQSSIV